MAGWSSEVKSQARISKGPPGFARPRGHINRQAQLAAEAESQKGTRRAATTGIGLQLGYGPGLSPEDDRGAAQCQAAAHSRTFILMVLHMAGSSPSPFSSAMAFFDIPIRQCHRVTPQAGQAGPSIKKAGPNSGWPMPGHRPIGNSEARAYGRPGSIRHAHYAF